MEIINNNIYVFNNKIDLIEIKYVLFNFNEDLLTFERDKNIKKNLNLLIK